MKIAAEIDGEIKAAEQHFRLVMAEPTRTAEGLAANGVDLNKVNLRDYFYIAAIAEQVSDWRTCQAVIPVIQASLKLEQHTWEIRKENEPKGTITSLTDSMKIAVETDGEVKATEQHFRLVMAEPTPTAEALAATGADLKKVILGDYYMIAEVAYKARDWRTRQAVIPLIIALLKKEMLDWETRRKNIPKG